MWIEKDILSKRIIKKCVFSDDCPIYILYIYIIYKCNIYIYIYIYIYVCMYVCITARHSSFKIFKCFNSKIYRFGVMAYQYPLTVLDHWYSVPTSPRKKVYINWKKFHPVILKLEYRNQTKLLWKQDLTFPKKWFLCKEISSIVISILCSIVPTPFLPFYFLSNR